MSTAGRASRRLRFRGRIAGLGTASGTRLVLGMWERTPLGAFSDAMIERADGYRTLVAPTRDVADLISATYTFDQIVVAPVSTRRIAGGLALTAGGLEVALNLGGVTPLGRLLRIVPRPVAESPVWLTAISPVASLLVRGVRTAGSAGGGRREYYGVRTIRRVLGVTASLDGSDLGGLRPLTPPVRFGFSSAPAEPAIVDVTTTIVLPRGGESALRRDEEKGAAS